MLIMCIAYFCTKTKLALCARQAIMCLLTKLESCASPRLLADLSAYLSVGYFLKSVPENEISAFITIYETKGACKLQFQTSKLIINISSKS